MLIGHFQALSLPFNNSTRYQPLYRDESPIHDVIEQVC